jgi:para-aminobenzoate synthetase component 1
LKAVEFNFDEIPKFKEKLLFLSKMYQHACILDSNDYKDSKYHEYDLIAGFGAKSFISSDKFLELEDFTKKGIWLFGFLSYDLKNNLEYLRSENKDELGFPGLSFFEPEIRVEVKNDNVLIEGLGCHEFKEFLRQVEVGSKKVKRPEIKSSITQEEYIQNILKLKRHIQLGDIFEVNFCQEFYAKDIHFEPLAVYHELTKKSPVPFGSFLKLDGLYCLGASPERFLKKSGSKIISQPIKGTGRRGLSKEDDNNQINILKASVKERSENVMIVDLVRNDLSKIANKGSVMVEELFGIYSFPQVHQMISTVTCDADSKRSSVDIIMKCFPMGSMTGAPKVKAMELIEYYESSKRGLFSGAVGYIKPNGDFDFNVVIRSILYNEMNSYLSFTVGGAITIHSNPEEEYKESLLKAKAIFDVLNVKEIKPDY